jgi:DHA1 family tetracycline resistance protein-like MFS transporter
MGRLLPIFGEVKLTIGGLICEMTAYLLIGAVAFVPSTLLLWGGIACYILGSGLLEPSLGGLLYAQVGHASPYWSGAVIVGLAILATFLALPSARANQPKPGTPQT